MAVTYGFYNSINKDRAYNAIQFSQIFDGVINDGIYMSVGNHFAVRAGTGMNVVVGSGRAWFNHTWTYNDSDLLVKIDDSEFEANRIDAIVIKIDRRDVGRANSIEVIKGTPAASPVKPTFPDGNDIYYHPLAYITVNSGVTEIVTSKIENVIGVDSRTPFVTGVIETISATDLIAQWQAEWNEWNQQHRDDFEAWTAQQETDMLNWETTQKEAFLEWMADEKADYEAWLAGSKTEYDEWFDDRKDEFDDWFANLHYILDGDVAGHLQTEIDDLYSVKANVEDEFKHYYDICTRDTQYVRNDEYDEITGWTSTDGDGITMEVTITENDISKTIVTVINDGSYIWTKTSTFNKTISTLSESFTKEAVT